MQYFFKLKPRYYCMIDSDCFADPATLTADGREQIDAAWSGLEQADWEMELIVPRYYKKSRHLQERVKRLSIHVRYLNLISFSGWGFLQDYFLKKQLCAPAAQTVLIAAVYYGICKGYKEIVLLGAEMNWFRGLEVDEGNNAYFNDSHHYGEKNKRRLMDGQGRAMSVAELLEYNALALRQYMFLADYAGKRDCAIYNATPNSLVQAFPRLALSSIHESDVWGIVR